MSIKDYLRDWLTLTNYKDANLICIESVYTKPYRLFLYNIVKLQEHNVYLHYPARFSSETTLGRRYIAFSLVDNKVSAKPSAFSILKTFNRNYYYEGSRACNTLYKIYVGNIAKNEFYYINRGMIFDKYMTPIMMLMKSEAEDFVLVINPILSNKNGIMEKYALSKKLLDDLQGSGRNPMIMYKNISYIVRQPRCSTWGGKISVTEACREVLDTYREDIFNVYSDESDREMESPVP